MDWTPPPEPMTWTLVKPIEFGPITVTTITVRSPTAGDILKASAIPGASSFDIGLRLIAAVSAEDVPYEAMAKVPAYIVDQISGYLDMFGGAPLPAPLEAWRKEQAEKARAKT